MLTLNDPPFRQGKTEQVEVVIWDSQNNPVNDVLQSHLHELILKFPPFRHGVILHAEFMSGKENNKVIKTHMFVI
jgi:hypothetical protein